MPPKKSEKPVKESVGSLPATGQHLHTWRLSYGPDGTPSQVCDCGAVEAT